MTPRTLTGSALRRRTAVVAGAAALATAATGLMSVTAHAGQPSASTAASITLMTPNPAFGGTVSFSYQDPPTKWMQEMSVTCTQAGRQVYLDVHGQNDPSWTQFSLWSPAWQSAGGGSASCVAKLYYYTWQGKTETGVVYEASTSFNAT